MTNAIVVAGQQSVAREYSVAELRIMAEAFARGRLFGTTDPYAVLTLMLVAQSEGKHPGKVFQQYHVIQGKPAKKADAMLEDFIAAGGKVEWETLTDECAAAVFSHPAGGTVRIDWTLARANKAGLGGKDMWRKFPRQMLRARVISEGVRTIYPGATSGFNVPEEVQDIDDRPQAKALSAPAPKRPQFPAGDGAASPAAIGPQLAPAEPGAAEGEDEGFGIGEPQWVRLEREIETKLLAARTVEALSANWRALADDLKLVRGLDPEAHERLVALKDRLKAELSQPVRRDDALRDAY